VAHLLDLTDYETPKHDVVECRTKAGGDPALLGRFEVLGEKAFCVCWLFVAKDPVKERAELSFDGFGHVWKRHHEEWA
jgi:hypothetical protein